MLEMLPLYAALLSIFIDLFNLLRPWLAKNKVVPDWPWQVMGSIVFLLVVIIVGIGTGPLVQAHDWPMVALGLLLIAASNLLLIYVFVGWKKIKDMGVKAADVIARLEAYERNIHIFSMFIAFLGVAVEIVHRWLI